MTPRSTPIKLKTKSALKRVRFEEAAVFDISPVRRYGSTEKDQPMNQTNNAEDARRSRPLLLLAYAVLSICLTLSFKRVFGIVSYPCSLMALLLAMEGLVIHTTICMNSICCPANSEETKKGSASSAEEEEDEEEEKEDTENSVSSGLSQQVLLAMVSICIALELGLSNAGLARMSVASHTMIRSCTPLFVLMASLVLGLEVLSFKIIIIVAIISTGTILCSIGRQPLVQDSSSAPLSSSSHAPITASAESTTQMAGVILTVTSGLAAGMRWGLTQLLTQIRGSKPKLLVAATLPLAAFALAVVSAALELPLMIQRGEADFTRLLDRVAIYAAGLATLGLCLLYTEVCLVATTSSLSLAILATTKETLLVAISIFGLHESISGLSASGFLVTIIGILAYQFHKHRPDASLQDLAIMRTTSYLQLSTNEFNPTTQGGIDSDDELHYHRTDDNDLASSPPLPPYRSVIVDDDSIDDDVENSARSNDDAPVLVEMVSTALSSTQQQQTSTPTPFFPEPTAHHSPRLVTAAAT